MLAHEGLANGNKIISDASVLEAGPPRIYHLMQVRILLCLGATNLSSNVNETHLEELEMLIEDLQSDAASENILVETCPLLAISFAESLLEASLQMSSKKHNIFCLVTSICLLLRN